jgi:hypothetical protein
MVYVCDRLFSTAILNATMTKFSISAVACFCLLLSAGARGQIVYDLPKLIDSSDVVAVARVMQGLGNLTGNYAWRPKSTEQNADWFRCLSHWREYRERLNHGE